MACDFPTMEKNDTPVLNFFDLKGFFEAEAASLNAEKMNVQKTIRHNGKEETQVTQIADWKEELRMFSDSDINRPAWREKYSLDSTDLGDGLTLLHYKAIDKTLTTQVLDVKKRKDKVHSILIVNKISNDIYESQQYLTYIPNQSYTIEKIQDVVLFDKDEYNIQVKYVRQ